MTQCRHLHLHFMTPQHQRPDSLPPSPSPSPNAQHHHQTLQHRFLMLLPPAQSPDVPSPSPPVPTPAPSPDFPTPLPPPYNRTHPKTYLIDAVLFDSCNPHKPYISNASNSSEEEKEFIPQTTSTGAITDEPGCCVGFAILINDSRPITKDSS